MSPRTSPETTAGTTSPPRGSTGPGVQASPQGFLAGRSELVLAGLVAAIGVYLTVGIITMNVPEGANAPGPQFFPGIIAAAAFVLALLLAVQALRHPEPPVAITSATAEDAGQQYKMHSDWKSLGIVLAAFLGFCFILEPLGWILSAAAMFWAMSYALGSRKRFFDPALALVFASFIQVAFSAGLGLALPAGILEGIF
ncbi:putative tricarboxylic transport membrane protein [Arthrobacter sp. CAN_A6]|uniref:tripartite tricarboxylate transporter TctB family protein n=1 Tax=Arthrobacter sp. CAN_A6 TaxID=2787721 RepID=UPI0018C93859